MTIGGYRPSNTFLRRQLDTRWRGWVSWCLAGAAAVSVALAAFVAPRQATMKMRYEIARLATSVDRLEGERRQLQLERERLTSPQVLANELPSLDLVRVPPERVIHMDARGGLLFPVPTPTPRAATVALARRGR